ncbi:MULTISPECIES: TRAP transporter large permease subunit [unclassified Chelatococcus]|uniref:TRAP transporter large permease n=1 Tax=unclassified Chelatococcus TaxID=2638111 RepID=UPI001BCC8CB8|nr:MULTISPECIES: TRAP transporter large permease subunit [unclassified Chelatococcus]MBS7698531.1 TRAP transporter large permease subunit [Chelatococcus sp. YT9]MBX3554818.1 TRAP transporter large permease subunit [Chelatococcus sp.]
MTAFIVHNMAPIMFAALVVLLLLGYPVAFALAANGLIFGFIGIELGLFNPNFLQALPERVYGTMNNEVLLAIPFFTFMGLILERSGMAEDLLDTIGQLFGKIRGGLAYAVVFVGALLAATTGVVAASVISMGLISLPIMLRYGYDRRLASGVIAASGTLAQIIPPSLVLIVMADQLGRSVGDMYEGAFIPGLVLALLYAGYIWLMSMIYPASAPGLPDEAIGHREDNGDRGVWQVGALVAFSGLAAYYVMRQTEVRAGADFVVLTMSVAVIVAFLSALFNRLLGTQRIILTILITAVFIGIYVALLNSNHGYWALLTEAFIAGTVYALIAAAIERTTGKRLISRLAEQVTFVMVPPLGLIFLVLGTIFIGVATPTEGGAMGAAGAVLLALARKRLNFGLLKQATESTAKLSAFVIFILIGARVFSLTFYGVDGHKWVEELLLALPGGEVGFLVFVNLLIFVLAFFLDYFELAFIIIPLLAPVADHLGIDLIWFGVMLAVNMQTSFMHPPFGFALFFLRSVAPREAYIDRITKKRTAPITTGQIYWGAVPFVCIQLLMVALIIFFPQMVMHYKKGAVQVDPQRVEEQLKGLAPPPGLGGDLPPPALDFK